jgi:hypothetical protein
VHRLCLSLAAAAAVVLVSAPAAFAARVHVRVEGKTQTIFGATEPAVAADTVLGALEAASARGEFYYHVTQFSFGAYVDQVGRYAAAGAGGWGYKVDGAVVPAASDSIRLEDGARVVWYWTTFAETGGPPTLRLIRQPRGCYRVLAQDDEGRATAALGATLQVDGRRVRTRAGRACIGPHRGLVRAVRAGSVRSNAVR